MRRHTIVLCAAVLVAFVASCNEQPTAPRLESGPSEVQPSFSFTGGSGTLLGTTDEGELVRVDLDSDSVTRIGDAGAVGGEDISWNDLAFIHPDTLYAVAERGFSDLYFYVVDPETGAILEVGDSLSPDWAEDLAFANDTLFANACCKLFYWLDRSVPDLIPLSPTNAFIDTLNNSLLEEGGLAVHPVTGDYWGIEATLNSQPRNIYRIDRATGYPDIMLRLGLNGTEVPFGFDGLHILPDGTFLATRGGHAEAVPQDSTLWEVSPVPDPSSGLAEVALIPLAFDTLVTGRLTGLEMDPGSVPDTFAFSVELTHSTDLYPWIRAYGPQEGANGTLEQDEVKGDSVGLVVKAFFGETPIDSQEVTITAEFLPRTGGHHHLDDTLSFTDAPDFIGAAWAEDAVGRPVTGSFEDDTLVADSLQVMTDTAGAATLAFRAGFVGGDVNVIAATVYDSVSFADTVKVRIRVPGLSTVESAQLKAVSYLVGQSPFEEGVVRTDTTHARDSIWHGTAGMAAALLQVAQELVTDSVVADGTLYEGPYYLQINDLSLPFGGAYTVHPITTAMGREIELVGRVEAGGETLGHRTHTHGVDVDINVCQVLVTGEDGQASRIAGTECNPPDRIELNLGRLLDIAGPRGFVVLEEGVPRHFHLRYMGGS